MEKHSKILWLLLMFSMSWLPMGRGDTNNIVVDDPLSAVPGATLNGVWGTNYVGTYVGNDNGTYSFETDGTNYFILNDNPLAVSGSTVVNGITGSTIFGYYQDDNNFQDGFLNSLNSTNYITIDDPLGVSYTFVTGVSGGNIIGDFATSSLTNSYFYNGTNFFTLNDTNGVSNSTIAVAISGGGVVGNYQDADTNSSFGFYFDGTNYTTIDYSTATNSLPFSISAGMTTLTGISGGTVVGSALDSLIVLHGFLWNTTNGSFTPIDVDPTGALPTWIAGISGGTVVGNTVDVNGITNGFQTSDGGVSYSSVLYPTATNGSVVLGIGGGTIYGTYQDTNLVTRNFVKNGINYTTIDGPPSGTTVLAASSNGSATNFVGSYIDVTGNTNSYFYNGTNSTYTTLNYTNASPGTLSVVGISGTNVAGTYTDTDTTTGNFYGFVYNGKKYTALVGPAAAGGAGINTLAGISGANVAGTYIDSNSANTYGFYCTTGGSGYGSIFGPQGTNAFNNSGGLASVDGISGSTVYGTYTETNSENLYGYRYVIGSGYSTTPIYGPDGTNGTGILTIDGMSGASVVGTYPDANSPNTYGFILSGSTYTRIYGPEGTNGSGVGSIIGISGNNVVGTYTDSNNILHGFLYNGTNYSVIDFPEALPQATTIYGVLGSMIYGGYNDPDGLSHGFTIQRGNQSITTYTIPSTNFAVPNPSTTLPLTNSFGLPITYTVLSGAATLSNNILTFTGAGTVTVEADQPGNNAYYAAAPLTNSVAIAKGAQTINFGAVTNQVFGVPFVVSPSASSGLQVSVSILSGSATNSGTGGTTITPTGAGTLVLAANQSGDSNYLAAAQVTNSVTVLQATQSIAPFTGITNIAFTTNPVTITLPAASSALPVTLAATGPATNTGNLVTLLGTGTVTLTASQSGNSNYLAASPVSTNFLVTKGSQTITAFATISTKTFGDAPFSVTPPAASSGLSSSLSIASGPASLSNNTLSLTGAGTVTLAADQLGNSNYAAAQQVTTSFTVNKSAQTIGQFSTIPNQQGLSSVIITNPPKASSGLPVVLSLVSGEATISGYTITPTNSPTTIKLAANQPGNTNYTAAPQVTTRFSVGKTNQSITNFTPIPNQSFSTNPIAVTTPSASSGLPVTISVISGPATLSGTNLTLTGVGTVVLAANQDGDSAYGPAPQVTTSFVVSNASQTIAPFATIPNHIFGDAQFNISTPAGGNSGLPVTLSILSGSASLSNNSLTITGAGTITVAADQAGDANYAAASEVTTSFVVSKASQTITPFANIPNQKKPTPVIITNPPTGGGSGQPVIISVVSDTNTVTFNPTNNTVTPTKKGVVILAANQAGDANYSAAPQVTTSFLVTLLPQSIGSFTGSITNGTIPYSPKPIALALPKATSALATKLSILSGPATLVGSAMSLNGTGTVTLAANQLGNGKFAPAPQTTISFTVTKGTQTIAPFTGIKKQIPYTPIPFAVTIPTANSGLGNALTISGAAVRVGNINHLTGIGTVTLTATNGGSGLYLPASRTTNFVVTQATQIIKPFKPIATQTNTVPFYLTNVPTASSGLPVSLGISSGFATIVTNSSTSYTITPTNGGSVTLVATQPGDSDYLAAHPVTVTFKVK